MHTYSSKATTSTPSELPSASQRAVTSQLPSDHPTNSSNSSRLAPDLLVALLGFTNSPTAIIAHSTSLAASQLVAISQIPLQLPQLHLTNNYTSSPVGPVAAML